MTVQDAILALNPEYYRVGDSATENLGSEASKSWVNRTGGYGDYVPTNMGVWYGKPFTVHVQFTATGTGNLMLASRYTGTSNSFAAIRITLYDSTINFQAGSSFPGFPMVLSDGNTHTASIVYEGTDTSRFYVDGVEVGTVSNATTYHYFNYLNHGAHNESTIHREHMAMWMRALSASEIASLHVPAAEPLDLSSGEAAESTWTAVAALVALTDPAPEGLVLSTGQVAEALWEAVGARVELLTPLPTPLIVQSGTAAQATFYGAGARLVLAQPPAGQLTLIAGEQAEAIWQALEAHVDLTEPVFVPVGEWQFTAYMPKGQFMTVMDTNSAEASMDKSQGSTRLNTNQIEAVMASKTLWPELKEEA